MADYSSYILPDLPITYDKPDEDISEAEKLKDNGQWFVRMSRWIARNFYNPFQVNFYNQQLDSIRVCDEMIENFAFYYGRQINKTFSFMSQINEAETIQAVYIPDQKIRQLIDHQLGNVIKMIQPIKKGISATILSESFLKENDKLKRQLEAKKVIDRLVPKEKWGVVFAPQGIDEVGEKDDIDDILQEFKQKQALKFVRAAQGVYYRNDLQQLFEREAVNELVGNVANVLVDIDSEGNATTTLYPCYNSIVDTRATDDFLSDALVSGGVQFLSPSEIFSKWGKWLDDDARAHITAMSQKRYSNINECYNYYNIGCENMVNWCSETGKVACATTYWIGKKDLPYRRKETKYGTKIQFLEPEKDYAITENGVPKTDENGKHLTEKGKDIRGDVGTWFVHKCTLIGNWYGVDYGYHPIQLRKNGQKQKPMLPTVQYVHRMNMGYARSNVSRLKPYAEERAMLKLKVQELVGKDLGMVYLLWADKMALSEQSTESIFKDFRSMSFSLLNKSGEDNNETGKLTAEALNFSLQSSISSYIELVREAEREMNLIVNTSDISLGTQTTITGKGVQENTISQSSLGQLSMYSGLKEHYRRVLEYAVNCEKIASAGKEKVIRTDDNEVYLLNITKDEKYDYIGIYLEIDDEMDAIRKRAFIDGIFAYGQQGGTLESAKALLNTVKLLNFNSTVEGEEHLEDFVDKEQKQVLATAQQQQAAQQDGVKQQIAIEKMFDAKMQESKDENANYRSEVTATLAAVSKMSTDIDKQMSNILQILHDREPVTPIEKETEQATQQDQPVQ